MLFTRTVSWCVATTSPSCQVSRPDTVLLSMGHHDCDTQTIPKNPVHPCRAIGNHEPTLRSSKSRGEGPTIGPGRRVGKRGAVPRRYKLPFLSSATATTEIYTLSLHDALPMRIVVER